MNKLILYIALLLNLCTCHLPQLIERRNTKVLSKQNLKEQYLRTESYTVHYYHTPIDKPNTLVFIHGFSANANLQWTKTVKNFAKDYNIILPDLLYHGKSTCRLADYSVELQCQSLKHILDTLKIKNNLILVGNSYGGLVASVFATLYPDYCKQVILNDPMHSEAKFETVDSLAILHGKSDVLNLMIPNDAKGLKILLKVAMYKSKWIPNPIAKQFVNSLFTANAEDLKKIMSNVIEHSEYYKKMDLKLNQNTFFIWGKNDRLIPYQSAYKLLNRYQLNESQLFIINKSGHVPNLESPKAFNKTLEKILKLKPN